MASTGTSLRALAAAIDTTPATLSRSLDAQAFTSPVSGRLEIWLLSGTEETNIRLVLHKALHELAAERRMRAKVEAALKLALDRLGDQQ